MKTNELTRAALDWAVGTTGDYGVGFFSTDWAVGGPIIERERIGIECDDQGIWFASYDLSPEQAWGATGPTPLIAAMRCYVEGKLGYEVDIPKEFE